MVSSTLNNCGSAESHSRLLHAFPDPALSVAPGAFLSEKKLNSEYPQTVAVHTTRKPLLVINNLIGHGLHKTEMKE
jgi:hypothetical protein